MRTRIWLSCALTAALAVGCTGDPEPPVTEAPPTQEPTEEPTPEPEPLEDVAGTVDDVTVADLSVSGSGLFRDGSDRDVAVPVDQAEVDAAVAAAADWLDRHLTDVQSGGPGLVVDAGLGGDAVVVSAGMTGPDHPVVTASYRFTVGARGVPEWIRVSTAVEREDGELTATFVFLPTDDGVALVAVQVGDGTPAPVDDATAPADETADDTADDAGGTA